MGNLFLFGALITLITWWILIALRHFWYCLKGLLKGFWWPFRLLKSVKYFWSYGPNEVCDSVISTSPFSQSIPGLWAASHGIPSITSIFPKLHISILVLSTYPLKNMLHSTWCVIASLAFTVPSIFLTNRGFFNFSILNPFSLAKVVSMNRPVALLSSNAFTATPSWFSNFSSSTFI